MDPQNHPENSATIKIREHIPCGYSISTIWVFDHIDDKHNFLYEKVWYLFKRTREKCS